MTVRVEKPSINVREKLAELDKPTGIAGEAMLRAETPQEQFNLIGAGRKNFIQNGAMGVSQRGTSFALTANNYTLDRWRSTVDGTFADLDLTVSQSTDAPEGFQKSLKVEVVTAEGTVSTEGYAVEQRVEAQNLYMLDYGTSNAKSLTLSFWVKSAVAGKYGINLRAHDGGDGYHTSYTINAADTWEYKTVYIKGNTLSGAAIVNDNGIGLWIRWYLINGSTSSTVDQWTTGSSSSPTGCADWNASGNDWYITGVQLELGKVATPFEHRSYGEELALCQRYCVVYKATAASGDEITSYGNRGNFGIGFAHNSSNPVTWTTMPVPMRSLPAVTVSSANDFGFDRGWTSIATYSALALQSLRSTNQKVALIGTTSGLSDGEGGVLSADPDEVNAKLIFDAEL